MRWKPAAIGLACLLVASAAGCGSSSHKAATTTTTQKTTTATTQETGAPFAPLMTCLEGIGYNVIPESPGDVETGLPRFEFITVWNLQNSARVTLALTFSRTTHGAEQTTIWTRREDSKIGKGVVAAPVVRIGKINVLWTAKPRVRDARNVYGCIGRHA
jgi:hypothetical protein